MRKRITVLLLVLALVASIISVDVFAAGKETASSVSRYSALILDTSGSMSGVPKEKQKDAALKFVESIMNAEGKNYVAIITLNSSSSVECEFTDSLSALKETINGMYASGGTNINDALQTSDEILKGIDAEGAIKNIVLCSDGVPESGTYSGSGKYTSADHAYSYGYGNAIYETAENLKKLYSIYTLGFFHSLSGSDLSFGRKLMNDIQNAGYYEVTDPNDLEFEFGAIAQDITTASNAPIIVIPGIMGSRLYHNNTRVWGDTIAALGGGLSFEEGLLFTGKELKIENELIPGGPHKDLYLEPDEETEREYGTISTYKNLINFLCDKYYLESGHQRDVYFYSYDWRQSNTESASKLKKELDDKKINSAVFIAHSMGGLVVSNFLKEDSEFNIEKIITLGTPYEGATRLLQAVLTMHALDLKKPLHGIGEFANLMLLFSGLNQNVKTEFCGVGELTPAEKTNSISMVSEYTDNANKLIIDRKTPHGELSIPPSGTITPTQLEVAIKRNQGLQQNNEIEEWYKLLKKNYQSNNRRIKKLIISSDLRTSTITPCYEAAPNIKYSELIKLVYGNSNASTILAEMGKVQEGISQLQKMDNSYFAVGNTLSTMDGATLAVDENKGTVELRDVTYGDGDGTVPEYSAKMMLKNSPDHMAFFDLNHNELAGDKNKPEWSKVKKWIASILDEETVEAPLKTETKKRHIVIRIACPVDVKIEHNGEILTNAMDEFSDSASFGRMDLIGNDGEIKMFCIDSDLKYSVTITGTDTGTMDYSVRYLDEEYNLENEYEILGVSITDDTAITSTLADKEKPVLKLDNDGDGTTDEIKKADDPAYAIGEDDTDNDSSQNAKDDTSDDSNDADKSGNDKEDDKTIQLFDDVPLGKWYSDAVYYCRDKGYMAGKLNNKFDPNGTVTRATITQVLYAMQGKPEVKSTAGFKDVAKGRWYTDSVYWAASQGIVAGYPDGSFKPDRAITREELATILYAYAKYAGDEVKGSPDALNNYSDVKQIQKYAYSAMQWAVTNGIVKGTDKGLEPRGTATRAQLAVMLKALDKVVVK